MLYAVDSSVAVPLLVRTHADHERIMRWRRSKQLALAGHAIAETYSVLTRLPGHARLTPDDAVASIDRAFPRRYGLATKSWARLPTTLNRSGVFGGAVYDALVGLAAKENGCVLATRDGRARATYEALGVTVEVVS